ncbi:hypothetical protein IWQ60_003454 [Tieghemiomyces parasiticus]|uniref:Uncharacterized protein n=1 Tax=Tieghemiomyces parasiticus TaxID=78921 RepID=A0A9W8ACU7_9FUNG|nr:hypothetical protein IWQ60_003454 [Tieghemiomyces parasiticus]
MTSNSIGEHIPVLVSEDLKHAKNPFFIVKMYEKSSEQGNQNLTPIPKMLEDVKSVGDHIHAVLDKSSTLPVPSHYASNLFYDVFLKMPRLLDGLDARPPAYGVASFPGLSTNDVDLVTSDGFVYRIYSVPPRDTNAQLNILNYVERALDLVSVGTLQGQLIIAGYQRLTALGANCETSLPVLPCSPPILDIVFGALNNVNIEPLLGLYGIELVTMLITRGNKVQVEAAASDISQGLFALVRKIRTSNEVDTVFKDLCTGAYKAMTHLLIEIPSFSRRHSLIFAAALFAAFRSELADVQSSVEWALEFLLDTLASSSE